MGGSGKQAVMVSVSEIKKNKAGKVTTANQLVLTGLATEGMVSGALTGSGSWAGGVAGGLQGSREVCFHFVNHVMHIWAYASLVNIFHIMSKSRFVNPNNHEVTAIHMGVLTHLQTERRDCL